MGKRKLRASTISHSSYGRTEVNNNRMHPILTAVVLLCALRAAVLVGMALLTGDAVLPSALTLAMHVGFSLALGSALLIVWKVATLPSLRVGVTAIALVLLSFSLFLSLSDPILMAIIGERLTPSTLSHFAGPGLFLSDYFWKPVKAYWPAVSTAVALLAAYIVWVLRVFWKVGRKPGLTPVGWFAPAIGLVAGGVLFAVPYVTSPALTEPVELDYVKQAFAIDGTRLGMSEGEATKRIRAFVGLPAGAAWVDDHYPLVYRWLSPQSKPAVQPDIFVFVVESMRGKSLRATNPDGSNLASAPAIEAMARDGVVFPHFLSNGFPSGPGFVGLSSGAWMHPVKRLDAAFSSTSFDRLGARLRSNGYRTGIVTYDVRYDDKTNWVHDVFEDVVDCIALGLQALDSVTTDQFISWVKNADTAAERPLFGVFLTMEPHLPYNWKSADGQWTFGPNLADNYARSLHDVDTELQRSFDYLKSRARWKDTVIIILGDHANFLDQGTSTGLPVDDSVLTGAIIAGGASAIGVPRVITAPASRPMYLQPSWPSREMIDRP